MDLLTLYDLASFLLSELDRLVSFVLAVLAAVFSMFVNQWRIDRKSRKAFNKAFKGEINVSLKRLQCHNIELLPHEVWDAAVGSGALRIFKPDQIVSLSRIYSGVRNYNYEGKRCRDLGERSRTTAETADMETWNKIQIAWGAQTKHVHSMGDRFAADLEKFLKESWLADIWSTGVLTLLRAR